MNEKNKILTILWHFWQCWWEDIAIIISILVLWPFIFNYTSWWYWLILVGDLVLLLWIFIRRSKRLKG